MASTMEQDLRSAILAAGAVAALVADRLSWGEIPQGRQRPLIVLWNTTRDEDQTMAGPSGLRHAFVQCDSWGMSYAQAKAVRDAVFEAINAFSDTVGGTVFQGIFPKGSRDGIEPPMGSPAQRYHRATFDLEVWFTAAA